MELFQREVTSLMGQLEQLLVKLTAKSGCSTREVEPPSLPPKLVVESPDIFRRGTDADADTNSIEAFCRLPANVSSWICTGQGVMPN